MIMRAFFAIALPQAVKNTLSTLIIDLKQNLPQQTIHWIRPQNMHITLQFLGKLHSEDIPTLIEHVRTKLESLTAFDLSFGSLELFPTPLHPKVISLNVQPHQTLAKLSAAVGEGITAAQYQITARSFRAHLSLGRIHSPHEAFIISSYSPTLDKLYVKEIVLFRSEQHATESKYTPLATLALPHK